MIPPKHSLNHCQMKKKNGKRGNAILSSPQEPYP